MSQQGSVATTVHWALHPSVLTELFSYFQVKELLRLRLVCRFWCQIADREYVWYRLALRNGIRGTVNGSQFSLEKAAAEEQITDLYFVPTRLDLAPSWKVLCLRQECIHLSLWESDDLEQDYENAEERFADIRPTLADSRCAQCRDLDIWMCLKCDYLGCSRSRNKHMVQHQEENPSHAVVIHTRQLLVWCDACFRYLGEQDSTQKEQFRVARIMQSLLVDDLYQHRQLRPEIADRLLRLEMQIVGKAVGKIS